MGQQQLFLILLSTIVVGAAVVIGITMFSASAIETNREELVSTLTTLGSMAQEYYETPTMLGGGGKKYKKWKIPKAYSNYEGGKFKVKFSKKAEEVIITATGKYTGRDNKNKLKIEAKVKPKSMKIKELN